MSVVVIPPEEDTAGRNGCLCQRSARSASDGETRSPVPTCTVGGERVEGALHATGGGGGGGGRALASDIGAAILTARASHMCRDQAPLEGECPLGVNGEVCIATRCDDPTIGVMIPLTMGGSIHEHAHPPTYYDVPIFNMCLSWGQFVVC